MEKRARAIHKAALFLRQSGKSPGSVLFTSDLKKHCNSLSSPGEVCVRVCGGGGGGGGTTN